MAGEVAGRRRHQRVRDGRRQGRRADRLPRVRPGLDRGLLPGGGPRGARRAAGAGAAVRHRPRQGPARLLHRALRGRRGPAEARRADDRALGRGHAAALQPAPQRARRARARRTRCARSSATSPARGSSSPRRRRPTGSSVASWALWDRTTLAICKAATQEGTRVRWRQYRSVWAWVEGGALPPPRDPAPFRRPHGAGAHRGLLRRLRSGPRGRGARRGGAPERARARRGPRERDPRRRRRAPCPASAAPARSRSCAAAVRSRSSSTPTTACRTTAPTATCAREDVLAAIDALVEAGRLRSDRRRASRSSRSSASPRAARSSPRA